MRGKRVLHVALAERAPRLAEVLRDRTEDRDLPSGQPRRQDEAVEAVVLGLATPGAGERILERLAHVIRLEFGPFVVAQPEVVDPDRRPVGRLHLVRPLVAHLDAHVLEHRQHVREEERLPGAKQLEREVIEGRLEWDVEAHADVAVRVEPLDPVDVEHRLARREVLAVGAWERLAVPLEERGAVLLAELIREGIAKVVAPGARRRGEPGLDLADVVLRDRALLGVDDHVEAREHRLRDARRVVDARTAERLPKDVLDPLPILGVEPLARQVDQAGDEAFECVPADEQPHAPALAQVEDPERGLEELVLRDLEELIARVVLEDVEESLVVVAPQQQAGALDHLLRLPPEDGNVPRARAVGGMGVEPEEAPLAGHLAGVVEALDADVVEVGGTVHGRPRVGLRQAERSLLTRQPPHLRRQLREADRDRPLVGRAQDAEARAGHRAQHVLPVLRQHLVLPIAEEREVTVVHPLEQVVSLGAVVRIDRSS